METRGLRALAGVNPNARKCERLVSQSRSVGADGCSSIKRNGSARGIEVVGRLKEDGKLGRDGAHRERW